MELGDQADIDRFMRFALAQDDPLYAALLLQRIADCATAANKPWVDPTPKMINDAGLDAAKIRLARQGIKASQSHRKGAIAANESKRTRCSDLLANFEVQFREAFESLRAKGRKRVGYRELTREARKQADAAGLSKDQLTEHYARLWLDAQRSNR